MPMYAKDTISDDMLFYGEKSFIQADSSLEIFNNVGKADNTSLFVFDADSVYKYIQLNIKNNIVNNTFIDKIVINNKIGKSNDTIVYK